MKDLTVAEIATNFETQKHIDKVRKWLLCFAHKLEIRGLEHDKSKLEQPEVAVFAKITQKLKGTKYGSAEYKETLQLQKPTIEHHYEHNRHHPEHFVRGIAAMNLVDVVEMFCDWLAATERHNDGDIMRSIEINTERFGLSGVLPDILKNTAEMFKREENDAESNL